ncbi:isoprenyl diphosphate synthase-like protein [Dinothrombium tinctorium]|uniref:Farnesyl pyrophosphate synthase n=2 Tax=Dinothrombium tinctorium TaxID=1965070 RepID=A0A3S3NZF3_9ACAR|nr:isoprenyl diphosphate synthase-like protein [Dinothrombium tinctorium]
MSKTELQKFEETFEKLRKEITSYADDELRDAKLWFDKVLQYNVPHGKKNRGMAVPASFAMLASDKDLTEENIELSRIVGWCIEFMQAYFLVIDDIMDHSITRRGQPCWYRQQNVGLMAINDGMLLRSSVYEILKSHCSRHPMYNHILDLFFTTCQNTEYGQCLDCLTMPEGSRPDFSFFTTSRHEAIVKWKTAFYSFDLPVRAAMYLAKITDEKLHEKVKAILLQIGHLFQVQDDYLDFYGDPKVIGKVGTDIEDGKCSWLAVEAFKRFNSEQKKKFTENYGIKDENAVNIIKDIYKQLDMQNVFKKYEEQQYKIICEMIAELEKTTKVFNAKVLLKFLDTIYKREK